MKIQKFLSAFLIILLTICISKSVFAATYRPLIGSAEDRYDENGNVIQQVYCPDSGNKYVYYINSNTLYCAHELNLYSYRR